jgi:hypothetical protein
MNTKKEYNKPALNVIKVKLQSMIAGTQGEPDPHSNYARSLRNSWDEKPTWDNE